MDDIEAAFKSLEPAVTDYRDALLVHLNALIVAVEPSHRGKAFSKAVELLLWAPVKWNSAATGCGTSR